MTPILGKNIVIQFYDGTAYVNYACATDCSIQVSTETKSVKTVGDGYWEKTKSQKLSYGVNLSGVIIINNAVTTRAFDLLALQVQFIDAQFRLIFEDVDNGLIKFATGTAVINSSQLGGGSEGFGIGEFTMVGNGPLSITDSYTGCTAAVSNITVVLAPLDSDPTLNVQVAYTGANVDTVRIDYSIDGGGPLTEFISGANGFFYIHVPSPGSHSIVFTPICSNGEAGTVITKTIITSPPISGRVQTAAPSSICGGSPTALFGDFIPGNILYIDRPRTIPITGYDYIIRGTNIYNINRSTGVIGADTGLTCGSGIPSNTYKLSDDTTFICGSGVSYIRLWGVGSFHTGMVLYTDSAMTIPATGHSYILHGDTIYNINSSTGVVGSNTGFSCSVATPDDYVLGNLPSICLSSSGTYYVRTTFAIGQIIYTNGAVTIPLTGKSQFVYLGDNHIYNIDPATGEILSDSGVTC